MSKSSSLNSALIPWQQAIADAPQILLGLSGGMDSILLLELLNQYIDSKSIQAVHINHGLSDHADQWQQFTADYCRQLGVDFCAEKVELVATGEGIEAAARDARYGVFKRRLQKGGLLFLAHHADDQVETVLYRLLRGSGVKGLAGMPESRPLGLGQLVRPLLAYSKQTIHREAVDRDLKWIEDESNADNRFDRNYIRNQVIPLVATRWPDYAQAVMQSAELCDQADQISKDLALTDLSQLDEQSERAGWSVSINGLAELSALRQRNFLRYWSEVHNLPAPSSKIINEILASVVAARQDASPEIILQSQCWARFQNRLYLLIHSSQKNQQQPPISWNMQDVLLLADGSQLTGELSEGAGLVVAADCLEIRYRQGGERCKPEGRRHSSSLKKLLLEYQLPPWLRDRVPLFYVDNQLVAVGDLWVCEGWSAKPNQSGLKIKWQLDSM